MQSACSPEPFPSSIANYQYYIPSYLLGKSGCDTDAVMLNVEGSGVEWLVGNPKRPDVYTNVKMEHDDRDHWSSGLSRRSYT